MNRDDAVEPASSQLILISFHIFARVFVRIIANDSSTFITHLSSLLPPQTLLPTTREALHKHMVPWISSSFVQDTDGFPIQRRKLPLETQIPDLSLILISIVVLEEQIDARGAVEMCAIDWELDDVVCLRNLQRLGGR